jgi:hypothetical protein
MGIRYKMTLTNDVTQNTHNCYNIEFVQLSVHMMATAVTVQMQELAISVSSGVITKHMILGGRFCIRF